jgi:putative hemolysin
MPFPPTLAPFPWLDVVIIVLLIALNGVLAMSELAIVSARRPRLNGMAKSGSRGAATALQLASDPGRFLSAVQIGITLIGILAGAYSGASLGVPVGQRLAQLGMDPNTAARVGFTLVIIVVTYLSLVIGELVPKQFALRSPERIAVFMAMPMLWIARLTAPLVWLLDRTSAMIFAACRLKRESEDHVTAEDLHMVVAEAPMPACSRRASAAIISGVVRLADRPTREVMTPAHRRRLDRRRRGRRDSARLSCSRPRTAASPSPKARSTS